MRRSASTAVVEWLQENGDKVAAVIGEVVSDPDASHIQKLRAANLGVVIEARDAERQAEDRKAGIIRPELPDGDDREAIESRLSKALANPIVRQRLAALLSAPDA